MTNRNNKLEIFINPTSKELKKLSPIPTKKDRDANKNQAFIECYSSLTTEDLDLFGFRVNEFYYDCREDYLPKVNKYNPYRGTVRGTRMAFDRCGVKQPENIDIPLVFRTKENNKVFLKRKIFESNFGELRKMLRKDPGLKLHIKPLKIQKGFKGKVIYSKYLSDWKEYPNSYQLLVSEYSDLASFDSARVYVRKTTKGKILVFCDGSYATDFVRKVVETYENSGTAPISYTFDIGFMGDKFCIVEFNESFSSGRRIWNLGNDKQENVETTKLFLARWYEIMGIAPPSYVRL